MRGSLYIIFFLIIALGASLALVFRTTIFENRATSTSSVAYGNSYIFASPLQAKADGKELIRLTVFLLDGRGVGVPNQSVSLKTSPAIKIEQVQSTTDDTGKAVFDVSSNMPGKIAVTASHNGQVLPQTVKVTFY